MNRPLGCLTGTGLIAGAVTVALVILAALISGNSIFSPGELNAETGDEIINGVTSHADLSRDCRACHPALMSDSLMGDRCLDCHTETIEELDDPASFHFGFANPANCRQCHTDHNGPRASLTRNEFTGFPHDRSGFWLDAHPLISQGGSYMCGECHTGSWREFEIEACRACHLSYDQEFLVEHINTFGPACLNCHDGLDTYGASFDHSQTRFALAGWHELADCGACHAGAFNLEDLQQTPTFCYDCHQDGDIHQLRLGNDCGQCHTSAGWEGAALDHAITGFPLEDTHADVDCDSCHVERQWAGLPDTCAGCHVSEDAHEGHYGTDCGACHEPTAWEDATFDHTLSNFPLTGAHVSLDCLACHNQGSFAYTPILCAGCHAEPGLHAGVFGINCQDCHSTSAWRPASFNFPHSFPMGHGGAGGQCSRCHPSTYASYTCYSCHEHNRSEVLSEHDQDLGDVSNCMRCHPDGREPEDD
jgi:hypothetical protein